MSRYLFNRAFALRSLAAIESPMLKYGAVPEGLYSGTMAVRRGPAHPSTERDIMATRPIASGAVAFGLVAIPIKLYSTNESSKSISLNFIHEKCGTRVKYQ